jgi:hypothetical protein
MTPVVDFLANSDFSRYYNSLLQVELSFGWLEDLIGPLLLRKQRP